MADRNAFVIVDTKTGDYFAGFAGSGLGEPLYSARLNQAEFYSSIAVADRFIGMLTPSEALKVRRVDLYLGDV